MLRLGDVITRLVQDAASGIHSAEAEAEAKKLEIAELLTRPEEELVSDEEVDEFLRTHFPDPKIPGETAIRAGATYIAPEILRLKVGVEEFPPVYRVLGVRLSEKELAPGKELLPKVKVPVLTPKAVAKVRQQVKKKLGQRRRKALERLLSTGVPSPMVETVSLELRAGFDRELRVRIPSMYDTEAKILPEAIGKVRINMRLER